MRKIKRLSPSGIKTYLKDKEEFYLRYLADAPPEPFAQTEPMAVGSAFDFFAKEAISKELGLPFDLTFESQVEAPVRDFARRAGEHCLREYKTSGAYRGLLRELEGAKEIRMEYSVEGDISGSATISDKLSQSNSSFATIRFLGKPDLFFIDAMGGNKIVDWKVNGYCSQASPKAGYVCLYPGGKAHKDATVMRKGSSLVNVSKKMEDVDLEWGIQLAIYAWLEGAPVGGEILGMIDQLACNSNSVTVRVAQHRAMIGAEFQHYVFNTAASIMAGSVSGHFFSDLSLEDSIAKQAELDRFAGMGDSQCLFRAR